MVLEPDPDHADTDHVKLVEVTAAFGKGLFAGVAGTAAMTVSSVLETRLRGRARARPPRPTLPPSGDRSR